MEPSTMMGLSLPGPLPPIWVVALIHLLEWVLLGYTAYVTILPWAGFLTRRERRRLPPQKRFAVVIPAHDERVVIGNLVDCCLAMDYPRRLFDVYVIADNCTDDTAAVAHRHGALTWGGVIRARRREWVHTPHTRAIAYAELAGGNGAG